MIAAYRNEPRRRPRATTALFGALRGSWRHSARAALFAAAIIVILVAAPAAQGPQAAFASGAAPGVLPAAAIPTDIDLLVGRSTVLNVGNAIARVSLTVPDIADAIVTAPSQLLIHGKKPGTISLFVWDRAGAITTYEVRVRRDLTPLVGHLKQLFPNETINVIGSGKDVVISGTVSSKYVIEKAAEVAGGYVEAKENVVNLLQQQEGVASNQVMLRVRFAEVSRSALQELGASFFANAFRNDWYGRTAPPGIPGPDFDSERGLVFSDFLNLFVFNAKEGLGGVVRALQTKGLFQSLAEPNLIATNGREASFLAGGEYPFPVVQPSTTGTAITIMFKEFGIRLNFTPTVLGGDLVHLKVRPEVSSLDFANAIELQGFRIPALSTRRTETEVELRDGQTFAIAGLLNNTLTNTMSRIPGIGDIPVLGHLFRSRAHQKNQTELVVMITPTIIRRGQMGASEGLPSLVEPYLPPPSRTYPNPEPYTGSPRHQPTQAAPRSEASPTAVPGVPGGGPLAGSGAAPAQPHAHQPPAPAAAAPAPLPSVPLPMAGLDPALLVPGAAAPADHAHGAVQPARPAAPTNAETRALERARQEERKAQEQERKAQEEERKRTAAAERARLDAEKRAAERQKADARAAEKARAEQARREEEQRRQVELLERDRKKREAEVARKNAESARRKAEEDEKRQRSLTDAALRLKAAQEAYEAEVARANRGTR